MLSFHIVCIAEKSYVLRATKGIGELYQRRQTWRNETGDSVKVGFRIPSRPPSSDESGGTGIGCARDGD